MDILSNFKIKGGFIALPVCILLLSISGCQENSRVKEIKADNFETINSVISLDNSSGDSPIIGAVSVVTTDGNSNLYLVDPRTTKIHSFTKNFSYRWSVGGQGSGPGLFNSISELYVNNEYLYAYESSSSVVTTYSLNGEKHNEWTVGEGGQRINSLHRMESGKFVATGWNEKKGTVLNVYDKNLKNRQSQFAEFTNILDTESPNLERQILRNFPGDAMPVNDSTIIYSPPAYSGQLLIYKLSHENKWQRAGSIKGHEKRQRPIIFHKSQDGNNDRSHLSGFHPDGGYFHAEFTSMSHGLYGLGNNKIAHLSTKLNNNDGWDLVIEYFDTDSLKLSGYKIVKGLIPTQQFQQVPLWMDKQGRIYLNENSDTPLRRLEISASEE